MTTRTGAPRLSAVMPMRNCGACVCRMLDSLPFGRIPLELVIVDDASTDDSVSRVEEWSRRRGQPVNLVRNARQLYSYTSRLLGLARATAPVIWCVDADDVIPANADVAAALELMEREKPDILHCKAVGLTPGSPLQQPLPWTEPFAEQLSGGDIFTAFLEQSYPPAILWNKLFSARLVRTVLGAAPRMTVRYFDVKFLGLLFLLHARSYRACNELVYEYHMRGHRPAWLYARQVDALRLLEEALAAPVAARAPHALPAFKDYCRRRSTIQAGHLSLMAEAELRELPARALDAGAWLDQNILTNISAGHLCRALCRSLAANAARLAGWYGDIRELLRPGAGACVEPPAPPGMAGLLEAAHNWLTRGATADQQLCLARYGICMGLAMAREPAQGKGPAEELCQAQGQDAALALLLANAQLARAITAIMSPQTDITRKAN